jgi:hypothetical protein
MSKLVSLVSILGRINPAIFDAIFPHGPIVFHGGFSRLSAAASDLNPQPLPPKEQLLVASAAVARDIAFAALAAEAVGTGGGARVIGAAIDDWCGTVPRVPIPWPRPWPFPWPLNEKQPDLDIAASRLVGALSLAAVAARLPDGAVKEAMGKGVDQLADVAFGQ